MKKLDEQDAEEEKAKKEIKAKNVAGAGVTTHGAKKPRNNANKNSTARAPAAGNNPEVGKPKPRGGQEKAVANKTIVLESDDNEDDEMLELIMKDRLDAYNPDSSSDKPAEEVTKNVPAKNAPARKAKKSTSAITEDDDDVDGDQMPTIVEDADEDEDFLMMEAAPKGKKGGGGRKPTNAKAKATAA